MKLTREWQEYDHDYTKEMHDIRTVNGKEYHKCWPNAGKFNVFGDADNPEEAEIPDAEVTHVRCNKSWMTEDEQEKAETKPLQKVMTIGHIGHGKTTLTAAISSILRDKQELDRGTVIADEDAGPFEPATWHNYVNYAEMVEPISTGMPYHKKHKPNTGLTIGSYKYKSKKNK